MARQRKLGSSLHTLLISAAVTCTSACVAPTDEPVGTSADAFIPEIFGTFISKAWDIFKEFGGAPSPEERLAKRMDVLQASINEVNARLGTMERELSRILSATVRGQNEARLRSLADRRERLIWIKNKLAALAREPGNLAILGDVSGESESAAFALLDPLNRSLWEWTNDDGSARFRHTAAYPVYVAALAARVAFIQSFHRPAEIPRKFGDELRHHVAFLRTRPTWWSIRLRGRPPETLAERVDYALTCTASAPIPNGATCDFDVTCRETIEGNRSVDRIRGRTCEEGGKFWAEAEAKKRAFEALGLAHMEDLAKKLEQLAGKGWIGEPLIGYFPPDLPSVGALYSDATDTPVYAAERAANGERPTISTMAFPDEPATPRERTGKWLFGDDGTIRHLPSGKCLEVLGWSTASGAPVTLWDCHGGANQRWTRTGPGALVNVHSGKCLEVEPGRRGTGRVITDRFLGHLRQADCTGRADQMWRNTRPSLRARIY